MAAAMGSPAALPPEAAPVVDDGGLRWVRSDISRGADLVDGSGWIAEFSRRLSALQQQGSAGPTGRRRLLRQVATDGDAPQFWGSSGDAPLGLRNDVLQAMEPTVLFGPGADTSRGPGRKVRLATGEEVIFWFNVGPPGLPRERVFVTAAHCPHQGVCLNSGELKDIEDIAGQRRPMIRCPRHNKMFDLKTGESPGNAERLLVYPCRFEHGHWYVAVGPSAVPTGETDNDCPTEADVDMAAADQPLSKRSRQDLTSLAPAPVFCSLPPATASVGRRLQASASVI